MDLVLIRPHDSYYWSTHKQKHMYALTLTPPVQYRQTPNRNGSEGRAEVSMSDSPTSSYTSLPHCREQRRRGEQEGRGTGKTTLYCLLMLELDVIEERVNNDFFFPKGKGPISHRYLSQRRYCSSSIMRRDLSLWAGLIWYMCFVLVISFNNG